VLNAKFGHVEDDEFSEFISSISPDVMRYLGRLGFFEKLADLLSPQDNPKLRSKCSGDYQLSESVLLSSGVLQSDLDDIFGVLQANGGCCDCEIL
jgi:hypothetical protein